MPIKRNGETELTYATGLVRVIEKIIKDSWELVRQFEESNKSMPPTAAFKCRSLVLFGCVAEMLSLIMPNAIAVSVSEVVKRSEFSEFYCVCGCVCAHEFELMSHLRSQHYALFKLFVHLTSSHLPISCLDLFQLTDFANRSVLLGSLGEQQHRIIRLVYLVQSVPEPPLCVQNITVKMHYSFEELEMFEKGGELLIKMPSGGRGRGGLNPYKRLELKKHLV